MAEQKLIISATTPDGLDASKTISNINPDASNEQLKTFAQMLNGLTDNSYGKTDRVIKYNCDSEGGGGNKQTPNLSLEKTSCSLAQMNFFNAFASNIITNSDGVLYIRQASADLSAAAVAPSQIVTVNGKPVFRVFKRGGDSETMTQPQTVIVYQAESDTFKAAEVTFTINA